MEDFTLNKIGDWKPCEFVNRNELDEFDFVHVYLTVDWDSRFVTIEESEEELDTSEFVNDVCMSRFQLDLGIDFSKFEKYYIDNIQPLFADMARNVINMGYIDDDMPIEVVEEAFRKVYDALNKAPAHYIGFVWHIDGIDHVYDDEMGGMDKMLALDGIDFMNANLNDMVVVRKIRDALETDCYHFVMDDEQFAEELEEIRNEIRGE